MENGGFGQKGDFGRKKIIETVDTPLTEEDINTMPEPPMNSIVEPSKEFREWWEEKTGLDHRKLLHCQIVQKEQQVLVSALRDVKDNDPFEKWDFF